MLIPIPIPQYGIGIVTSVDVHFWNFLVCFLSRRAKSIGIGRILQNPLESYVFRLQASRPQVWKYGPVPAGKHRKSTERGSSIPVGNFWTFFWRVPINSCSLRQETAGNHLEKIETISGWNTASVFRSFPEFSCGNRRFPRLTVDRKRGQEQFSDAESILSQRCVHYIGPSEI